MKYEELIAQLCEVIKESENNAQVIYDNTEMIDNIVNESEIPLHKKEKIGELISNIYGLLQSQDLHRQKIERVVNFVCEKNNIKGQGIGRITSVTHSPELGHWIGIGFVEGGLDKWKDTTLIGADPVRNKQMNIKVVSPHMVDPTGERMYA